MTTRRIAKAWYADFRFTHPDGRTERIRKRSPVQTKRGAEEFERQLRDAMLTGRTNKEVPRFKDFAQEFLETYAKANNKPSEQAAKESILRVHLVPAFGRMALDEISVREVEHLKARLLAKGLKPKSVNNALTVLGRLLNYAAEVGVITSAPRVKFLKVMQPKFDFLTFEELERLVEAAEDEVDVQAAIIVGADAGLRAGEIRALEWQDVDMKARRLTVRQADWRGFIGTPKGRRSRTLDLTERLWRILQGIRHLRGEVVFCHADGRRWNRTEMDTKLWRVCKRAGLRRIGWHVLRHTFCSHLAMQGVTAKAIQELAGHSSLSTTERYMHLTPDVTSAAIKKLDARPVGNRWAMGGDVEEKRSVNSAA